MVSTYSNKKNWYKSVEECRKVDAEMFNLTHAITNLNSVEGNWVSHTGKNLTFDLTLWGPGDPPEEPVFTIITTSDKIYAGEDIILSCSVDGGIPEPVISLEKNGQYMKTEETWQHSRDTVVFVRNTSFTLSYDDNNATVKCIVNYNGDVLYQQNATLNVMYPPIITVQDYVEVNETDDVVIKCTVTSNPASPVWWTRPNYTDKSNDGTLNLTSIYRNAIGSYICNAENEIDSVQNTTVIYINAPPKLCLYQYEATEENQTVQIKCSGTGIPTPNITWHNSSELITDMVIQTGIDPSNSYLVVSELKVSVSGNDDIVGYRCMITNEHGKAQKTFRIRRKLKCRCRSRILKNCAPLEFTPVELKVEMEDTEKILMVKKEKLTVHKMKMISGHDGRSSSFLIGTVGVIVLVTLGVILIVFDLCGYFVINRKIKPA
ncbi:peroxidasin homolog [Ylistrum balloti]|uniref:peroxidasin homolog n=1 Tax=Ylistrum balloti TaxID=509963 RepID=UPI0029058BC5|nr:peroxidasin homolog [Ylistrum balloti]